MPEQPTTSLGRRLAERRQDGRSTHRWRSQHQVAEQLEVSQAWVSLLENGYKDAEVARWRPVDLYDLFLAYALTPSEMLTWARDHQLERFQRYLTDRTHMVTVEGGGRKVLLVGLIGRGRLSLDAPDDATYITCPDDIAALYRLDDLFAVRVDECSMLDDHVRSIIPPGSAVFLHRKLQPAPGEIVCAYLAQQDHTALLRRVEVGAHVVLRAQREDAAPFVQRVDADTELQGVYLGHQVLSERVLDA